MTLKEQILSLITQGLTQAEVARQLKCSSGTVCYHVNPYIKDNILQKRRERRKLAKPIISKEYVDILKKELNILSKDVSWKHAEAICIAKMIERGYDIFIPFNDGGEIDFMAIKDGIVKKIQVKSASPNGNRNHISINLSRSSLNYKKHIMKKYEHIDFFLIYDGTNIYKIDYITEDDRKRTTIQLRYKVPHNNALSVINMAKDYIF